MFNRYEIYGSVHKGLRYALSGLCSQAGSIDLANQRKVEAFIEEWRRVVIMLEAHCHDEDVHLNGVYAQFAPETGKQLEEEHEDLDWKLQEIDNILCRIEHPGTSLEDRPQLWYQLGKKLNRFTAEYFVHLQREEGPGMEALWNHLNDEQIHELSFKIRSSISPEAMLVLLSYMLPAITRTERLELLSDIKRSAASDFYEEVLCLAESCLEQQDWLELAKALERNEGFDSSEFIVS
ncbi:hemerythrin domain-containing protein [Paenibacillus andongensis]|uniref:hemerythrin domain-containing protein n=1 Tax=Paenibacillus andongensis TaxID=2975482 RepID=UPI0021BAF625|nr:hemerythrin domain-containing protein [Paenibacillus andongensis]